MTEVFITNIHNAEQAAGMLLVLQNAFPELRTGFDPGNEALPYPCGHSILRVEGAHVKAAEIIQAVTAEGALCEVLQDKVCK